MSTRSTNALCSQSFSLLSRDIEYVANNAGTSPRARTRELPGSIPFVVQQDYIKEIVAKWSLPALAYLESVQTVLSAYVKKLVTIHFESFGQGALEQRIK